MKKKLLLLCCCILSFYTYSQNIGIGTTTPQSSALLHVNVGNTAKGVLVSGEYNPSSTLPSLGAGSRLMFYPSRAAFRAGYVVGTQWDNANVGRFSFATGFGTTASEIESTAFGHGTTASGQVSIAIGYNTTASGGSSTAMGFYTTASSYASTAMGSNTTASGYGSTAMGYVTTASGWASVAMGEGTTANGDYSFAAGKSVSTNGFKGSFFFGDSDPYGRGIRSAGSANHFAARFNGGYYFISSNSGADIGVQVPPGGNAWVTISDVHRKENFAPIDGEDFLQKIASLQSVSWNYKGQDAKSFRHYGPMAQDFYAAFGKDSYGTIGNDTTINGADFDGVNLIAIQALEKRTSELQKENEQLKKQNEELQQRNKALEARLERLEKLLPKQD